MKAETKILLVLNCLRNEIIDANNAKRFLLSIIDEIGCKCFFIGMITGAVFYMFISLLIKF